MKNTPTFGTLDISVFANAISNNIPETVSKIKLENYLKSVDANFESFDIISLDNSKFIFKYEDETFEITNENNIPHFLDFLIQDDFMNKNYYKVV